MRFRAAAAALVVACVAAFAVAAPDAADPLAPLKEAMARQDALVDRGDFDTLIAEARERSKDGTPGSLYLLGRALGNAALAHEGETDEGTFRRLLDESQRCFEDAKETGVVVYAPAYLGLARCCRLRKDEQAAIGYLEQALRLAPGFKEAAVDLAQLHLEKHELREAESILRQQLDLRPADGDVRILLGLLKLMSGRYGEAEREARTVVQENPEHPGARKLLGTILLRLQGYEEAAEHLETYRLLRPHDAEAYRLLFVARVKAKDRDGALKTLEQMQSEFSGLEEGLWAQDAAEQYRAAPEKFETADERTPEALVRKLDSKDPGVLTETLTQMLAIDWQKALPEGVYRLLAPSAAPPEVRAAAVRLIAKQQDPRTLTILEILLFHDKERDPDAGVRREAARALATLPTKGIIPVLYRALDSDDAEVREAAVRGICAQTGKYFRPESPRADAPTSAEDWPAERALYDKWWKTQPSASLWKRDAVRALEQIFAPIQRGRRRLAVYAVPALEDDDPKTWRAGYDLFRTLTAQEFWTGEGEPTAEQRASIRTSCLRWLQEAGGHD